MTAQTDTSHKSLFLTDCHRLTAESICGRLKSTVSGSLGTVRAGPSAEFCQQQNVTWLLDCTTVALSAGSSKRQKLAQVEHTRMGAALLLCHRVRLCRLQSADSAAVEMGRNLIPELCLAIVLLSIVQTVLRYCCITNYGTVPYSTVPCCCEQYLCTCVNDFMS